MNKLDLLPNINKYLENIDYNVDCKLDYSELLIEKIAAKEHLNKDIVKILLTLIFNEIRNNMLNGTFVGLKNFGTFKTICPKNNNKNVSLRFKNNKSLFKALNEDQ